MWFNGQSEEHMLTWYSHRYSIEGDVQDFESFDVSTKQLLNLSEHTQATGVCVCVYASWSITDWTDLPIWSSGYWSSLWSRSLHSHPLGVFCSFHAVPSLVVTALLWSANQIKRRRSQRTNRQHRMCYFFPLSLSLCLWMHFPTTLSNSSTHYRIIST